MHPDRVVREKTVALTDLPNVGPSIAGDLRSIGIETPEALCGRDPLELYRLLCERHGKRLDPCLLDVFISVTDFMDGGEPRVWWDYTEGRKCRYGGLDGD